MKKALSFFIFYFILTAVNGQNNKVFYNSVRARDIGPALKSGRITDLAGHPSKQNVLYIGTAGGGVWKSVDAGINFSPIFDEHCQSIGTIAIDPSNPDGNIWVGTGETWTRNSTSIGCGIYKSEDGGSSWKSKGLENSERISNIIISPTNPDMVFVGVLGALWGDSEDRGIYKTVDGGKSWKKIFYINERTGCSDLIVDPNDENIMYASFWEFRRKAWSFESGGYSSGLYKTIDGGKNWNKIHNGLPVGKLGRIAIAIAPSKSNILYTVVEAEKKSGLYRSDDYGKNWKYLNGDFSLIVRPFYFSRIVVDPKNPDIVIKAGLTGSISRDGGNRFKDLGGMHGDIHDILFNKENPNIVYFATDGGVYRSLDKGNGLDFVDNIPVAQFYNVSIDNAEPYNVYGGLQDNGSWFGPSVTYDGRIGANKWTGVGGGDGFRVFKHSTKPIVYSEMQSGEGIWRYNQKYGDIKVVKPYTTDKDTKLRFNWNTAMSLSPNKPDRIYIGSQFVHVSDDMGDTWKTISPDLTTNDPKKLDQENSGGLSRDNSGAENHCTIFSIAESELDLDVIWVGTDDGNLYLTKNNGKKWKNVINNIKGLPKNTWCYQVLPSHFDKATAFVVFDGHTNNDKKPYIFKTTDFGKSWKSLATPEIKTFVRSIAEDYKNPNLLFVGSEMGLYLSLNSGKNWHIFNHNLPPVAIHTIVQDSKSGSLILGTHGRGVQIIDDIALLRGLSNDATKNDVTFIKTDPYIMYEKDAFYSGGNDHTEFKGENPNRSAKIVYYLKKRHVFGKMQLKIVDENGKEVVTLVPEKSKGLNIVYWNYHMKAPKIPKGKNWMRTGFATPRIAAGKYKVVLTKGKKTYEQPIEIRYDSSSSFTNEDRKIQYSKMMKLYVMIEDLAYLLHQIETYETNYMGLNQEHKSTLKNYRDRWDKLQKTLVVTRGDTYVGTVDPELREKISGLFSDIANYQGRPSNAQLENLKTLEKEFDTAKKQWKKIVKKYDAKIKKLKVSPFEIKSKEEFLK